MATSRVDINAETVRTAIACAQREQSGVNFWGDKRDHYLLIRQRGRAVDWLVKTRGKTRVIGELRERRLNYLSVTDARKKAARLYAQIANGEDGSPAPGDEEAGWTWEELAEKYRATFDKVRITKQGRVKHPRKNSQDDIRLAFDKPSIAALGPKQIADLKPLDLVVANRNVKGFRQRCKCLTYVQAALNWALSQFPDEAGLLEVKHPWWMDIAPAEMTEGEVLNQQKRKTDLADRKKKLTVEHLGELLVRHESYCVGRTAEEKVSPGVRFGFWWLNFTGNRRFSVTALERDRLLQVDEFGNEGWGRAMWPEWLVKGGAEFWLPLPAEVLAIANFAIADYSALVQKSHGHIWPTRWVFASTRRVPRRPDQRAVAATLEAVADVAVYPNSLNQHVRAMRGEKRKLDGTFPPNILQGLPYYSPHLVRTVITNTLDNIPGVSRAGISAMLAHAGDKAEDLSRTTREFYLTNQRMAEKSDAMAAWRDALLNAYVKAGGKPPRPSEA